MASSDPVHAARLREAQRMLSEAQADPARASYGGAALHADTLVFSPQELVLEHDTAVVLKEDIERAVRPDGKPVRRRVLRLEVESGSGGLSIPCQPEDRAGAERFAEAVRRAALEVDGIRAERQAAIADARARVDRLQADPSTRARPAGAPRTSVSPPSTRRRVAVAAAGASPGGPSPAASARTGGTARAWSAARAHPRASGIAAVVLLLLVISVAGGGAPEDGPASATAAQSLSGSAAEAATTTDADAAKATGDADAAAKTAAAQQRAEQRRQARAQRLAERRRAAAARRAAAHRRAEAAARRRRAAAAAERRQEAAERRRARAAAARAAEEEEDEAAAETSSDCDPNYQGACLDPTSSDYDCEGGSGDGPDYTGLVHVVGSDPFDLDRDGDGVACE